MTTVVNLIGPPGVGKSVCAGLIFAELKMRRHTAEYVQEYAKHLVWKNDLDTINNQYYVSSKQYELLNHVNGKVRYIVTDGSLVHGLIYNELNEGNVCDREKTRAYIVRRLLEFRNVFIFLQRGDYPFEQEGRIHTYEESVDIGRRLKQLLDALGVDYLTITSAKENVPPMMDFITQQNN